MMSLSDSRPIATLCDRHSGDAHPPRCTDCDLAAQEHIADQATERAHRAAERAAALAVPNRRPRLVKRRNR